MQAAELRGFADAIDAVRERVQRETGADDLAHIRRMDRFSSTMEVAGRALIHASLEPISFAAGVTCLWIHKQLQAIEIGHTALHGAFDRGVFTRLAGARRYRSAAFRWRTPIDEDVWRELREASWSDSRAVRGLHRSSGQEHATVK